MNPENEPPKKESWVKRILRKIYFPLRTIHSYHNPEQYWLVGTDDDWYSSTDERGKNRTRYSSLTEALGEKRTNSSRDSGAGRIPDRAGARLPC